MNRLLPACLLVAACAAPAVRPDAPAPPPEEVFAVVSTTDVHGNVSASEKKDGSGQILRYGGFALAGGYVANLRQALDGRVLLLDGGDMWQGTMVSSSSGGRVVVEAMNALGYRAAALGNHELDWGRDVTKARAEEQTFPLLSANVVVRATGKTPDWPNLRPYIVVEVGGRRVGLLGLTTIDTPSYQRAGALDDLDFRPLIETALEWAPRVRAEGVDALVLLVHEGADCDAADDARDLSPCKPDSRLFQLARALPPGMVDLVIGAHSHKVAAHYVGGVPVIQAGEKGRHLARADLVFSGSRLLRVEVKPPVEVCESVYVRGGGCDPKRGKGPLEPATYAGSPVLAHAGVVAAIAPFEEKVRARLEAPVGAEAATPLTTATEVESELGDLITDAMRAAVPGAHVALQNSGGIRAAIDAGPITYGELYDVLPFGNALATLRLTGAQLRQMLVLGTRGQHGLTQVSGVRLEVDRELLGCPGRDHLVSATLEDGSPIRDDGEYLVATSEYLASGGGGYRPFVDTLPKDALRLLPDRLLRDVVAEYLGRQGTPIDSADHPLLSPDRPRVVIRNPDGPQRCP